MDWCHFTQRVINLLVISLFVTHLDAVQNKMAELFICNYGAKSLEQALKCPTRDVY